MGRLEKDSVIIYEAVDGGPDARSSPYYFIYDEKYVLHITRRLISIYTPQLQVVGVWHKHNSYHKDPFSYEDIDIHKQLYDISKGVAISCIFQKISESKYVSNVITCGEYGGTMDRK